MSSTKNLSKQLKDVGIDVDFKENNIPERDVFLQAVQHLEEAGDKDARKSARAWLKMASEEYSLVFHKWFAQQYPNLLHERGEDKTYWNYDIEEGIYVEVNKSIVRGMLLQELADEGLKEFAKNSFSSDCLSRYRGEFTNRAKNYEDFDNDDEWFHANNGWIHLDTLEFITHTPDKMSRRKSDVDYDKDAKCPVYDKFMDKDCKIAKDAIRVIDQFSGLLLTHDIRHQKMLTLEGKPGSGKSTLLELWSYVLGDLVAQSSLTDFSGDKHRFIGSSLVGRNLCWFDEVEVKRAEMSSALEKKITNNKIEVERKGIDGTRYAPNYLKFVLTANTLPLSSETGMYRRLLVIPFNRSFTSEGCADKEMPEKMRGESSGVLNRMLKGLLDIRKMRGFTLIAGHAEAIEEYKISSNTVAEFLDMYFEPVLKWENTNYDIPTKHMMVGYQNFLGSKTFTLTPQRFGQMLKAQPLDKFQGIKNKKGGKGVRSWTGLELKEGYMWSDGTIVGTYVDSVGEIVAEEIDF